MRWQADVSSDVAGDVASCMGDVAVQGSCIHPLGWVELKMPWVDSILDSSANYRLIDSILTQVTLIQDPIKIT